MLIFSLKWARAWQNQQSGMCTRRRLRWHPVWSECCALYWWPRIQGFSRWIAKMLIRLGTFAILLVLSCCGSKWYNFLIFSDHSYSPCTSTSPFDSDLVTAAFEEPVSGTGCVSNGTDLKTGAEVHAICYHGNKGGKIELYLNDNSDNHGELRLLTVKILKVWTPEKLL